MSEKNPQTSVPPHLQAAVAIIERLVQQVVPGLDRTLVDAAYDFLKKYPIQDSYAEQYSNGDIAEGHKRSVFDSKLNVNDKEAEELVARVGKLYETGDVLVLTGAELGKLAQTLYEMKRHLPGFFGDE